MEREAFAPESPDCCWKCGRLGHHRQECTARVTESQEKTVSRLCKRMQRDFEISKKPASFKKIPELQNYAIVFLEKYVDFADNFYFDIIREVEDVGRPVLQPIQEIKLQKDMLHAINMRVISFNEKNIDLLLTCKNRLLGNFNTGDAKENFERKVADLEERKTDALNISNKMTMWAINAIGCASSFWAKEGQLSTWMESIKWTGRPNLEEILSQNRQCTENWRKFGAMQRESRNLQNICDSSHVRDMMKILYRIKTRLNSITVRSQQLEVNFKKTEIETTKAELLPFLESQQSDRFRELETKMACCLCQDEEKKWALLCGHMYCTTCIEGLEKHRTAEGLEVPDPYDARRTVFTAPVPVPSECAMCRGSIETKIRVFF